ncbi:hypothetical protein KM043_002444 [Ampulex compressa]|nr:hypothetical protein KM043_002444 [Ampulex compressa]
MCKLNILLFFHILLVTTIFTVNSSSYCEVREPKFNILYNFTKLTNVVEDIVINGEHANESIRIQLCSPLKGKCDGRDGYGICLGKDKKEIGIGKLPPKIVNKLGEILFTFTGDDCNVNAKYKVTIQMKCDYLAVNNTKPELSLSTEKPCNFNMVWKSIVACGPRVQQNCTVSDHGNHYDLSTLTKYSDNYVIRLGDKKPSVIILNICHSVIFQGGAMCQSKSGVCLRNFEDEYINLGDVQGTPILKNNELQIEYTEGAICKNKNIAATDIKTTISFVCDLNAMDTLPVYVKGNEECHYQLTWRTAAACSVESLRTHRLNKPTTCAVTNPVSNLTYDLQSLTNKDYYVMVLDNVQYKFRVCGPLMDKICNSGTGVCLVNNGTSMGKPNSNLMWKESGPYLNYTNGDLCSNGQRRYTIISFVCGNEVKLYTPVIMEEHPCWFMIHWQTNLVCEKRVKCITANNEIDLTPLMNETSNYVVKVNGSEFHINVCQPLAPISYLMCAHGSAACKATATTNNQFVNVTNLGFPKDRPVLNKDQQVELHYFDGSPCPEDSNKKISSNLTFFCDPNNKGQPEYKSYANCTYIFEWKTSITCGAVTGEWSSPCIIKDRLLSHECDLSLLYVEHEVHHVTSKQGKQYSLNLCGDKKYCTDSAICQGTNNYGSLATVIFDYNKDVIKLQYSNGSKCTNSSYTSEVRFICNETVGVGVPNLLWVST